MSILYVFNVCIVWKICKTCYVDVVSLTKITQQHIFYCASFVDDILGGGMLNIFSSSKLYMKYAYIGGHVSTIQQEGKTKRPRSKKVRVRINRHSCMSHYTALISYDLRWISTFGTHFINNNMSTTTCTKAEWYPTHIETDTDTRRKFPCDTSTVWCVSSKH